MLLNLSPELVIQAQLGDTQIAFTEHCSELDPAAIDARLDTYLRAVARQQAKHELGVALVELATCRQRLAEWPAAERDLMHQRGADKARQIAGWEAAHVAAGKRGEFRISEQQRRYIDQWDSETLAQRQKLGADKALLERSVPLYEAKVARQRAIIEGRAGSAGEALEQEMELAARAA